jgi:xanthine dehydrogenase accessory factor
VLAGWDWIAKLKELTDSDLPVAIVTVAGGAGSVPREAGAKMLVLGDGRFFGTIGGGNLEARAIEEAREVLSARTSRMKRFSLGATVGQCCGGAVDLFFECVNTGPRLYLYGAGHVGQAVCRVLEGTAFRVHVVDEREEWLRDARGVKHDEPWEDFNRKAEWSDSVHAVVMTHRHDLDEAIVADLVRRPAKYIGLIGSRTKWTRFQQRLTARGFRPDELTRVKCPIGLGDFGKSPQEVAVSLVAELLKTDREAR